MTHPIPQNWQQIRLEDVAVKKGLVRGPFGGALKKEIFVKSGYKVYEQRNAIYQSTVIGNYFVNEEKFKELSRFELIPGDFIISCSGTIGRIYQIPEGAPKGIINQALLKIRIDTQIINEHYFYNYFSSRGFQSEIIDNTQGGAMQNLVGMEIFKNTKILLPPLPEQQRIVAILSVWDKAIKELEKKIDLKKNVTKGLMHRLLTGKLRLPGFTEKWKLMRLGDVVERVKRKNNIGNTNVLTISAQDGLVNQEAYFYKQIASENLEKYTLLERGDFAYNKSYSQGYPMGAIKRLKMYESGVVSSLYICFKSKRNVESNFLDFYFYAGLFNKEIGKVAQEGARNHGLLNIGVDDFFDGELCIPDLKEQQAIANILLTSEAEISLLEQSLKKLKEQKAYLLNHLLTGRIRTPENMPISKF